MVIACVVVAVFYIGIPLCEPFFVNWLFRYGVVIANSLALGYVVAATGAFFVSCKCQICESGVSGENQRYHVCGKHCSDAGTFVHHQWIGQFCDNSAVFYFCRCLCTAGVYLDFEE